MNIDIEDFFSKENEVNGIWHEICLDDVKTGIEVKVYGRNSQRGYDVSFLLDFAKKTEKTPEENNILMAKCASLLIIDIRGKDGYELTYKGKPVTIENLNDLLINAPLLCLEVIDFALSPMNFINKNISH